MALPSIHFSGKLPIYEEIADSIEYMVLSDMLEENEQLPSVRELANDLAVNPNTIQKAYCELEKRGITYSLYGKGNFVVCNIDNIRKNKLKTLSRQIYEKLIKYKAIGGHREDMIYVLDEVFALKKEDEN